jgi:RNA polymerase sigma factor (sigma-70 family)
MRLVPGGFGWMPCNHQSIGGVQQGMPEKMQTPSAGCVDELGQAEEDLRLGLIVDLDVGFAEIMRAHERVVFSVALRLSANPADAEDVAAEAFLRAYRALRGYDAARIRALRIRPWLLTILRNTARNAARDASRRPDPPPMLEPTERAAAEPSVEQQVEHDLMQREWARVLARLPEAQRVAVVLRHVEGLPTSEIAEILGCPEGTAKSHVSRGLNTLRALVSDRSIRPPRPARTTESGGEVR